MHPDAVDLIAAKATTATMPQPKLQYWSGVGPAGRICSPAYESAIDIREYHADPDYTLKPVQTWKCKHDKSHKNELTDKECTFCKGSWLCRCNRICTGGKCPRCKRDKLEYCWGYP